MTRFAREALKLRIVNYYSNVANNDKNSAVKHFKAEQIPESTIYSIIRTYLRTKTTQDMPRSDRPKKIDKKIVKRLVKSFRNKDGCSQRVSAKKCNLSHRTVGRYLKKNGIDYFKKIKLPFVPEKQLFTRISRCNQR